MTLNTRRNFNLIKESVEADQEVKAEKSWYVVTNVLVVCACVIISVTTYVLNQMSANNLAKDIEALETQNIAVLESNVRVETESKLQEINDKYTVYRTFIVNNIDFTLFYNEITSIYPGLLITEFSLSPETNFLEVSASLPSGGYGNLASIIEKFDSNEFFDVIKISNISFSLPESENSGTSRNGGGGDFGDFGEFSVSGDGETEDIDVTKTSLVYNLDNKSKFPTNFSMVLEFNPEKVIRYNF